MTVILFISIVKFITNIYNHIYNYNISSYLSHQKLFVSIFPSWSGNPQFRIPIQSQAGRYSIIPSRLRRNRYDHIWEEFVKRILDRTSGKRLGEPGLGSSSGCPYSLSALVTYLVEGKPRLSITNLNNTNAIISYMGGRVHKVPGLCPKNP